MASYQGTREKSLSTLSAMEGQARRSLAAYREKAALGGELMAPTGGPNTGMLMGTGSQRTTRNRQSLAFFRSWVYVCVDAIARRLAAQELGAGEIENATENPDRERAPRVFHKGHSRLISPAHRAASVPRMASKYIASNQQLNVFESHACLDLLARPNDVQRKFEFLYMSAANLLLTGECYWIGAPDAGPDGGPEIWAVPTTWVTPVHDEGLFSSYLLQVGGQAIPKTIPPEMVARTYFADPADLKSAYSPLRAIMQAIVVDDHIQESQKQLFERGINPNLIVTVGRVRGEDGTLTDRRPVLSGPNRRQIIRSVREIWNQTVSAGDPAILDGLIESVHKLHNTPQEMDWPSSGEIVKKRIMQGYKVNPIVVGEVTAGNRAQAVEAEKNFCGNAVNPISNALSETATDFIGPWYEQPTRLVVWIEESIPTDPEQELREWSEARKNEDVTRDEFRANVLGIPPLEERDDPAKLLNQQGGIQGISAVTKAVSTREITPEQGSRILQVTLRLSPADADLIAGVGLELPEPPPPPPPVAPPPSDDEPADDEEPPEDDGDDDGNDDGEDDGGDGNPPPAGEERTHPTLKARKAVQALVRKQAAKLERGLGRSMAEHFRRSVRNCAEAIRKTELTADPENAQVQAGWLVARCFDYDAAYVDTVESAAPYVGQAFAQGAFDEIALLDALQKAEQAHGRKTTAEDVLARYNLQLPPGVSVGEAPAWFRQSANDFLDETFNRDYWTRVDLVTRDDIQRTLEQGIREGYSTERLAGLINQAHGAAYSMARATNVTRTEMTGAMNAGHEAGIAGTAGETGLPIGKEWLSVLGNTTRRTHADADGEQTATADGLFSVGGYQTPYPGHGSLPPEERCNCQCTIISSLVMEAIDQYSADQEAGLDVDTIDEAAIDQMPVKDVISSSESLDTKQQDVLAIGEKYQPQLRGYAQEAQELQQQYDELKLRRNHVLMNGLRINESLMASDEVARAVMDELQKQADEVFQKRLVTQRLKAELERKQQNEVMKRIGQPTKDRSKFTVKKVTKAQVKKNARLADWVDDEGKRRSIGEWKMYQNERAKETQDFFQKLTKVRPGTPDDVLQNITTMPIHIAEENSRAFYLNTKWDDLRGGINVELYDPKHTWIHEAGHHVEYSVPGVQKRANEFREYRIAKAGTPNRVMQEVMPGYNYTASEIGNEDDFIKAFDRSWSPGRTYDVMQAANYDYELRQAVNHALYTGKHYGHGSTEVISMGCELLSQDPIGFARRDPEFFKFIVGVLDGTIR